MSLSIKTSFLAVSLCLTLPLATNADSGLAVPAIIGATLSAGILGSLYGTSLSDVMQSGIGHHQASVSVANDDDISSGYLAYRLDAKKALWQHSNFVLTSAFETTLGQWTADRKHPYRSVTDMGLTPIFKIKSDSSSPWYLETGIGVHYISDVHIRTYSKSTQFQFGDQFGLGWENKHIRIGYKFLHVSNANIELPNPATEFNLIELGYRY